METSSMAPSEASWPTTLSALTSTPLVSKTRYHFDPASARGDRRTARQIGRRPATARSSGSPLSTVHRSVLAPNSAGGRDPRRTRTSPEPDADRSRPLVGSVSSIRRKIRSRLRANSSWGAPARSQMRLSSKIASTSEGSIAFEFSRSPHFPGHAVRLLDPCDIGGRPSPAEPRERNACTNACVGGGT